MPLAIFFSDKDLQTNPKADIHCVMTFCGTPVHAKNGLCIAPVNTKIFVVNLWAPQFVLFHTTAIFFTSSFDTKSFVDIQRIVDNIFFMNRTPKNQPPLIFSATDPKNLNRRNIFLGGG